jgi:hypothetical protein
MAQVILDTTALVDLSFWDREQADRVRGVLPGDAELHASSYAMFELARGFVRYLRLVHAKCRNFERLSDVVGFLGNLHMQPHYAGAVRGSVEVFLRTSERRIAATQQQELLLYRGFLRQCIRRGWRKAESYSASFNPIRCRTIGEPKENRFGRFDHELPLSDCGKRMNCGLRAYFAANRSDFENLRDNLAGSTKKDRETERRVQALRELYRNEKRDFDGKACYSCGDAIICHEVPAGAAIITSNGRHYAPIASTFGRTLLLYSAKFIVREKDESGAEAPSVGDEEDWT